MTHFSLKRPVTVLMISMGLCLLGYLSWQQLPVQLLPQLIYPEVYVGAGLPGGSPEEVERQLVIPVEAEIATLEGVKDVESTVNAEFFSTKIVFNHDVDMQFAILKLQQKMTALESRLPENSRIQVNRFDTSDLSTFLMQLSIRGDRELTQLRDLAERKVRPQLEQVDGVVNVAVGGGSRSNIGIVIDADKCEALGVPMTRVQQQINAFHRQPEHLGQVIAAGLVLDVNLIGRVDDLRELQDLVIDPRGVRLRDVAQVGYSEEERTRLFRVDGKAGVGIFVQKDNASNMLQVADAVLSQIDDLNQSLKNEGVELMVNFSQAELIATAIDRVKSLAVTGAFLALIVLFLFLRNLRFVTILMIAIPVSLLVTANFMYAWGLSINIVSLCGLALAIGMLVDNGIVVMENIFTHYQQGKSVREATLTGTKEVSRSIFAATGTTVLVFLPVLFIESDAQLFVRELALSVMFPLCVSFVVALTLVPLLASRTLSGKAFRQFGSGRIVEIYRLLLKSAVRHRIRTISTVVVFLLISIFVGVVFILQQSPPPPPDRLDVYVTTPQGATLDRVDTFVRQIEDQVMALPDVKETRANIQVEQAQVTVAFLEPDKRTQPLELEKNKNTIRRQNNRTEGFEIGFERPTTGGSSRRQDESGGLLEVEKGLRLRGNDINMLRQLSEQITQTLRSVEDIEPRSVQSEMRGGAPEIRIIGDRLRLAMWGLSMQQVMTSIWGTRAEGTKASTPYYNAGNEFDIQMQLKDVEERRLQDLEEMRVANTAGQLIPLKEVADIRVDEGPGNIIRYNQERQTKITYKLKSEAESVKARVEAVELQIDQLMQEIRLPRGFTLERLDAEDKTSVYYWMLAIAGLLIFMFLAAQFESFFSPFVIIGTIPTAIIGALIALTLTGTPLSLGQGAPMAILGLIVLLGIVVNNGIILLDRIAILRNEYGFRWQRAVIVASQNRVRPILMTSATTILGIFPLALKQGTEFEIWPPFAITVLGGLTVSALSTLVFIPVLYVGLEQTKQWLKKIGWPGLVVGSLVAGCFVYWFHQNYESLLYSSLVALPTWFGVLGLIFAVQQLFAVRKAKSAVLEEKLHIRISNLTKIYGAPGRFNREWRKQDRRLAPENDDSLPWEKNDVLETTIWIAVIGILLLYLHSFFTNGFWLFVLTLATLTWFFAAREYYYRWRFLLGKPPKHRKRRKWLKWPWKRKASKVSEPVIQDESILTLKPVDESTSGLNDKKDSYGMTNEEGKSQEITPFSFPRRGGLIVAFLTAIYVQIRIDVIALTFIFVVVAFLLFRLYLVGRKIERGEINPELPEGRLRKIKRGIYSLVKIIPIIRPPRPTVVALQGVDLEIGQGMFGLLGPNGAGKTTLMRSIVGVLEPDRGSIKINGRDLNEHRSIFHGAIGYLPQDFGLYENMTPFEYLNYHATVNGIYDIEKRHKLINQLLDGVGLDDRKYSKIKTFSGGMKQRVGIAQTLLHLPQIIVVDEPTAGLDPRERIRFRNLLSELAKDRIVIFSTHVVEDVSSTCHDLAVLDCGRVVYRGSPVEMEQRARGKVFEAVVPEEEFAIWREKLNVVQHSKAESGVRMRFISEKPVDGLSAKSIEPTLEDAYVLLLGGRNGEKAAPDNNE